VLVLIQPILVVLAAVLLVGTLLPLSASKAWWVRVWDFPRAQIATALACVAAGIAVAGPARVVLLPPLLAALAYQLWRIRPYTRAMTPEMVLAPAAAGRDIVLMAANVLMENGRHQAVRNLVEEVDPDVLLLMETNEAWVNAVEPTLARYPTVVRVPKDNYYGLVFATRLEAIDVRAVRIADDDTPAVFAELKTRDGAVFRFVGLHPRPPVPGEDSESRDAQILYAARFAAKSGVPLVAMGDFNDAAWSDTAQRFKHVGGYLDPRIGRGFFSSFDATRWWFRCPIDQLYATPDVAMVSFRRGPDIGSDHFPIIAEVRLDAELARGLNRAPTPLPGDEAAEVERHVARWRDRLGPDAFPT